ncbi:hypothetical protein C5167_042599 [Papaver somniferum]|uniref:H(+)-exporting diphosphatase n=1 Tax=Papaver somniferum TaxID=3469 RepID=A0A4Y7L4Z5_PAPSO|nr:hypothetical protein C5167_042599 [Papaver somniferum]
MSSWKLFLVVEKFLIAPLYPQLLFDALFCRKETKKAINLLVKGLKVFETFEEQELRLQSLVKQSHRIRERADALDAAGNTTAAIEKGFAIGSDVLLYLLHFWCLSELSIYFKCGCSYGNHTIIKVLTFSCTLYCEVQRLMIKLLLDYIVGDLPLVTFKEPESSKNACE